MRSLDQQRNNLKRLGQTQYPQMPNPLQIKLTQFNVEKSPGKHQLVKLNSEKVSKQNSIKGKRDQLDVIEDRYKIVSGSPHTRNDTNLRP